MIYYDIELVCCNCNSPDIYQLDAGACNCAASTMPPCSFCERGPNLQCSGCNKVLYGWVDTLILEDSQQMVVADAHRRFLESIDFLE